MSGRGILLGWLGLVVLETVVTVRGSDAVSGILGDISRVLSHALDPNVPGIANRGSAVWKKGNTFPTGGDVGGVGAGHQFPSAPEGTGGGITPRPI